MKRPQGHKRRTSALTALTLAAGLSVMGAAGCGPRAHAVKNGRVSVPLDGRQVEVHVAGPATYQASKFAVIVSTTNHVVAVWRDRVLVDGVEFAALPGAASNIQVNLTSEKVAVAADGVSVAGKPPK